MPGFSFGEVNHVYKCGSGNDFLRDIRLSWRFWIKMTFLLEIWTMLWYPNKELEVITESGRCPLLYFVLR